MFTARLFEGIEDDHPEGRYIYLRSFDSNRHLLIDRIEVYSDPQVTSTARRLEASTQKAEEIPRKADKKPQKADEKPQTQTNWILVRRMRRLTRYVCDNMQLGPSATEKRTQAAMLWADLTTHESTIACHDCNTTRNNTDCTLWFTYAHNYAEEHNARVRSKHRKLKEHLEETFEEHKQDIRSQLGKGCCRTHIKTGKKECGPQHCTEVYKREGHKRMAHTLRRMHDGSGPTTLNIQELVSTDMVEPSLHADPKCQSHDKMKEHGELECLASSLVGHLATKHGFSEADINKRMERYGMTIADMLTAHLRHSVKSARGARKDASHFRSDPQVADHAAQRRRKERARRRMAPATPKRKPGPRGAWVARSTAPGRRQLSETALVAVEPAGRTHKAHRKLAEVVQNHSTHAKKIMRAVNLGAATMGTKPPTTRKLVEAAWDAAVSTDGSLFGRARSILGGLQTAAAKSTEFMREFKEKSEQSARTAWKGRRKLHAHEHAAYDKVDEQVGHAGWEAPQQHVEDWGWIVESVDWVSHVDEARRVAEILHERNEALYIHAAETGTLPSGDLHESHQTGYKLLDINVPPSYLGELLRGMVKHSHAARERRLGEDHGRKLETMERAGQRGPSLVASLMEASIKGDNPLDVAVHALQHNEHRSWTRKLAETATKGFLGGASYVVPGVSGLSTVSLATRGGNATTELARWAVYDVALW